MPTCTGSLVHLNRGRNYETSIFALQCAVDGCTPVRSCLARNGCPAGDAGTTVVPLPLTPRSATYYLDYGSVLAAFAPVKPNNCEDAVGCTRLSRRMAMTRSS